MKDFYKKFIGKRVVVVYNEPECNKALTVLGTVKDIDEFSIVVEDSFKNVLLIGKRAIIKIKIKNGGGQNA